MVIDDDERQMGQCRGSNQTPVFWGNKRLANISISSVLADVADLPHRPLVARGRMLEDLLDACTRPARAAGAGGGMFQHKQRALQLLPTLCLLRVGQARAHLVHFLERRLWEKALQDVVGKSSRA